MSVVDYPFIIAFSELWHFHSFHNNRWYLFLPHMLSCSILSLQLILFAEQEVSCGFFSQAGGDGMQTTRWKSLSAVPLVWQECIIMQMLSHTLLKIVLQRNEVYYIHEVYKLSVISCHILVWNISLLNPSGFFIFAHYSAMKHFACVSRRETQL